MMITKNYYTKEDIATECKVKVGEVDNFLYATRLKVRAFKFKGSNRVYFDDDNAALIKLGVAGLVKEPPKIDGLTIVNM